MPDRSAAPSLDEACAAVSATPARIKMIRFILDSGEVTAKDVMAETGLSRNAVGYHLTALTEARILHERRATHPRGSGPIIYWSADRDVVRAVRDVLYKHLS